MLLEIPCSIFRNFQIDSFSDRYILIAAFSVQLFQGLDLVLSVRTVRFSWARAPLWYNILFNVFIKFTIDESSGQVNRLHYDSTGRKPDGMKDTDYTDLYELGNGDVIDYGVGSMTLRIVLTAPYSKSCCTYYSTSKKATGPLETRSLKQRFSMPICNRSMDTLMKEYISRNWRI